MTQIKFVKGNFFEIKKPVQKSHRHAYIVEDCSRSSLYITKGAKEHLLAIVDACIGSCLGIFDNL